MGATLTKDCLLLDRTFAQGEHNRYQRLIEERRSWGYYQHLEICDAAGARLAGFPHVKFEGFIWTPPANTRTQEGFLRQERGALTCRK
jgi:hypothetical protein